MKKTNIKDHYNKKYVKNKFACVFLQKRNLTVQVAKCLCGCWWDCGGSWPAPEEGEHCMETANHNRFNLLIDSGFWGHDIYTNEAHIWSPNLPKTPHYKDANLWTSCSVHACVCVCLPKKAIHRHVHVPERRQACARSWVNIERACCLPFPQPGVQTECGSLYKLLLKSTSSLVCVILAQQLMHTL